MIDKDVSLDALLLLDGEVFVIDQGSGYWVKFVVKRVPVDVARPHGLSYSLTLHAASGERLVGFDNAHPRLDGGQDPGRTITGTGFAPSCPMNI